MTEEFPQDSQPAAEPELSLVPGADDEYEEISSEEVDRVVSALEELIESVHSDNICSHLEEAMNNVFYLVYTDEDLEDEGGVAEAA